MGQWSALLCPPSAVSANRSVPAWGLPTGVSTQSSSAGLGASGWSSVACATDSAAGRPATDRPSFGRFRRLRGGPGISVWGRRPIRVSDRDFFVTVRVPTSGATSGRLPCVAWRLSSAATSRRTRDPVRRTFMTVVSSRRLEAGGGVWGTVRLCLPPLSAVPAHNSTFGRSSDKREATHVAVLTSHCGRKRGRVGDGCIAAEVPADVGRRYAVDNKAAGKQGRRRRRCCVRRIACCNRGERAGCDARG